MKSVLAILPIRYTIDKLIKVGIVVTMIIHVIYYILPTCLIIRLVEFYTLQVWCEPTPITWFHFPLIGNSLSFEQSHQLFFAQSYVSTVVCCLEQSRFQLIESEVSRVICGVYFIQVEHDFQYDFCLMLGIVEWQIIIIMHPINGLLH